MVYPKRIEWLGGVSAHVSRRPSGPLRAATSLAMAQRAPLPRPRGESPAAPRGR